MIQVKPRPSQLAAEKLRQAAVLVLDVINVLDVSTARCDCCGRVTPNDPIEHQAEQALTQQRQKMLDWADTLYLPPDQRDTAPKGRQLKRLRYLARRHERDTNATK